MWRMLCARGKDLHVIASGIEADDAVGHAHWVATYSYSATGRRVENRIDAAFAFRDGLIARHDDRFDLWRWARQALGAPGWALGWAPPMQRAIRTQAAKALASWREREPRQRAGRDAPRRAHRPTALRKSWRPRRGRGPYARSRRLRPRRIRMLRRSWPAFARNPRSSTSARARRCASRQPGHARRADAIRGAPLSRRVPRRSARGRDSACAVARHPARLRPAHPAGAVGAQVRDDLEQGRLAAARAQRQAALAPAGASWAAAQGSGAAAGPARGRARHALRASRHRRRDGSAQGGRLRADPRRSALSAIRGERDRVGARCGLRARAHAAAHAGASRRSTASTTTRATSARSRRGSTTTG